MANDKLTEKEKEDPALSFKFGLEIDNLPEIFFMECSGLKSEREVEECKEGGENSYVHKLPGRLKYPNVVLKRGVTSSNKLFKWYQEGKADGKISRKKVTIALYNPKGETLKRWSLEGAFPVKWSGPDFKTDSSSVAVETLEFVHHGITLEEK